MIIIDGDKSDFSINNYTNLEEALIHITSQEGLASRIVTDVIVNKEPFSELYPHQAEDIDTSSIESLELKTVTVDEMSHDILEELPKVVLIVNASSTTIAGMLRKGQLAEALEFMQDMIDVSRHLLQTIAVLIENNYSQVINEQLQEFTNVFSDLLTEISESMSDEDWILTADLIEYELVPATAKISSLIGSLKTAVQTKHVQ